jgi:hypothetical protein
MDYLDILKKARERITYTKTLLFVDFLQTLVEWVEILYQNKRLHLGQKDLIDRAMPRVTLESLQQITPTAIPQETHDNLKRVLLQETTELIDCTKFLVRKNWHPWLSGRELL